MIARLLVFLSATSFSLLASNPDRLPGERYARLRTESPFAVATPPKETTPREPWEQNLYLASVAKIQRGGTDHDWVIIRDRTQPGVIIQLVDGEPRDGYELLKLEWSEDPRKTRASVKKGEDRGTIETDQAAFKSAIPPRTPPPPSKSNGANGTGGRIRVHTLPAK
jgi:hypothetical protein